MCSFDVTDFIYTHRNYTVALSAQTQTFSSEFVINDWKNMVTQTHSATLQSLKLYKKPKKMSSVLVLLDMSTDFDTPHFQSCHLENWELQYTICRVVVFLAYLQY